MILDVQPNTAGSPSPSKLPELLVLTHRIPFPPDRGDRIRSWNIIQHLSQRANISLACVTSEPIDARASEALRKVCSRVAIAPVGKSARWIKAGARLVSGRSMTEGLFWSSRLAKTLDHWADTLKFDSVLVYCSSMMPYVYRKRLSHIPRVVDLVDVDSQKWRDYAARSPQWKKLLYRTEASRVQSLEKKIIASAEAVMLASDAEADLLRDQNDQKDGATIYGITNGVDVNFFDPSSIHPSLIPSRPQSAVSTSSLRLVFVGVLDYLPNIDGLQWFVANVWPKLKERVPSTTLEVIGRHPTAAVQKLGRVEGVHIVGSVDDVRPHLLGSDVVIAPLQIARGIQNKVLEAMAMAKPVVATSLAAEGIDAIPDKHIVVADEVEDWVDALATMSQSSEVREQLGRAGQALVRQEYTWPARLRHLDQLLGLSVGSPETV